MYLTRHFIITSLPSLYNEIVSFLNSLGWILYDEIDVYNKVYYPPGETAKDYTMYLRFYIDSSSVWVATYAAWNTTTHTGSHQLRTNLQILSRTFSAYPDFQNHANAFIVGNKDYFFIAFSSYVNGAEIYSGSYGWGYIPNIVYQVKTTCLNPVVSGSNVTLQLITTDGLTKNQIRQMLDRTGKTGCELVTITDVDTVNHTVTLASVTQSYPDGVYLGTNIFNIFCLSGYTFTDLFSLTKTGTDLILNRFLPNDILYGYNNSEPPGTSYIIDHLNPNYFLNMPLFKKFNSIYPTGYFGPEILEWRGYQSRSIVRSFIATNNDNTPIKNNYSYPTSVSLDRMSITDIRKNWEVDSLIGKCVGFIGGQGAWQSRRIASNTTNQIVFVNALHEPVDLTSQYIIVDRIYRTLCQMALDQANFVALDTY